MTAPESYPEEKCFNVYWKIKNFSYILDEVRSPEFSVSADQYVLDLRSNSTNVECYLRRPNFPNYTLTMQISFLTCDGSEEESISGVFSVHTDVMLRVKKNFLLGNRRESFLPEDTLTVRFRVLRTSERGKLFIWSQIGVKRKQLLWTNSFSKSPNNETRFVENSKLYGRIALSLKLMCGINSADQFNIEISRYGGERCFCVLKISILDVNGKAVNEVSDEFVFAEENALQTRGFPSIIKKSKWNEYKNKLLSEDKLSLKCDFAISLGKVADETAVVSYCENAAPLLKEYDDLSIDFKENTDSGSATELQADLKSVLNNQALFDTTLKIGSEIIPVHKILLSARSPVFMAMFTKDMQETINNTVEIEDLDVETVRRLLFYMYTDSIHDRQYENMKKLYSAADKYEVLSLKKECSSFLKTNLSISNVCETLVVADLHNDAGLNTAAIDFISEHDSTVFDSEVWMELEKNNPYLALKLMREIYCNKQIRLN